MKTDDQSFATFYEARDLIKFKRSIAEDALANGNVNDADNERYEANVIESLCREVERLNLIELRASEREGYYRGTADSGEAIRSVCGYILRGASHA